MYPIRIAYTYQYTNGFDKFAAPYVYHVDFDEVFACEASYDFGPSHEPIPVLILYLRGGQRIYLDGRKGARTVIPQVLAAWEAYQRNKCKTQQLSIVAIGDAPPMPARKTKQQQPASK